MQLKHTFFASLVACIWGLNFVVSKIGVQDFPPILFTALRFLSVAPLAFFTPFPQISFKNILFLGIIMGIFQFLFLNLAVSTGLSASIVTLVFQTNIFFTLIFAHFFLKERIPVPSVLGITLGLCGVILMGTHNDEFSITQSGFLCALMAAISSGLGSVFIKHVVTQSIFETMVFYSLVPIVPLFLLSFFFEGTEKVFSALSLISWREVGCILYSGGVSVLVGGWLWTKLLITYPTHKIMPFSLLVSLFALFFDYMINGYSFPFFAIFPGLLIWGGLAIAYGVIPLYARLR